jgi:hypothetical protein
MKKNILPFLAVSLFSLAVMQTAVASYAFAEEPAAKGDEGGKGKKSEDMSGGRFAGDPIYIHIAPMVLPVINGDGVEQLVTVILDVQVKDFDTADAMHANMPRVMDSLMRSLYGGLGQGALRSGKLVNVTKVKNKAIEAVGEVVGSNNVVDVLVQGVSQRML